MNAIAAFFLSGLAARTMGLIMVGTGESAVPLKTFLHRSLFASWLAPANASLAFALAYVAAWLGVMAVFYRKGIFIKV